MLKNLKMRRKLLLMLAVPIAGLLIFSVREVNDNYRVMRNMTVVRGLTGLAVRVGDLSHEIQKERGFSSGYLNANGQKFKEDLSRQREVVDAKVTRVKEYLAAEQASLTAVQAPLAQAHDRLNQLHEIRSGIDSLRVSGKDSYQFYTALIDSYLQVLAAVSTSSQKHEIMRTATAYYGFARSEEETGKERATLNAVLAAGRFDPETWERIFAIRAAEKINLNLFETYASAPERAAYREKAQSQEFARVDEMSGSILAKGTGGGFGITPEEWFTAVSKKMDILKEVEDFLAGEILKKADNLADQARHRLTFSIIFSALVIAIALGIGFLVFTSIITPLHRMLGMLKDIAEGEGDLTRRLAADRGDEIGEVSRWFNRFVDNVHGIISQLAGNTQRIFTSSENLNAAAEKIATAAEEVACQSSTVATAGEEMSATSTDISRNCARAAEVSSRAGDTAAEGAKVVHATLAGMEAIASRVQESAATVSALGARSEEIGEIVGTIEDIAEQTNLLALNAAIEAARAGEQGRGFAVVADEVRALADRTTRATREISGMIKAIQKETSEAVATMQAGVKEVEQGMAGSRSSESALQEILSAIDEVNAQVHQMAAAAEEQTAVTAEISSNIHQISDVVSETARGAHETATAASQLSALAEDLQRMVSRFRLT